MGTCSRRAFAAMVLVGVTWRTGGLAHAQGAYPVKPIRIVIPFGPGGGNDVVGRLLGQRLSEELGQQVVIENKPGAGGGIASQMVVRAAPDGYTLMIGTVGTQVVNQMLYSKLAYDPNEFTPVSLLSNAPFLVATNEIAGVNNLTDLVRHLKAHPGQLNAGSAGNGSAPHLAIELFKLTTQTQIVHVPYNSGAEAVNAALSNQVQIVFDTIALAYPHVKAGKLKAMALASRERNAAAPDLPTSVEQGVPGFQVGSWNCLMAPPGVPGDRVATLNAALGRIFARADWLAKLAEMGIDPLPLGPAAYDAHVKVEREKWTRVVKAAGTRLD